MSKELHIPPYSSYSVKKESCSIQKIIESTLLPIIYNNFKYTDEMIELFAIVVLYSVDTSK